MIAPCVSLLRELATKMREMLGSELGTRHAPANLSRDIATLMASLRDHEVYQVKGRVFAEGDGTPVVDVISSGFEQLASGETNPLSDYNTAFTALQTRSRISPLLASELDSTEPSLPDATYLCPRAQSPTASDHGSTGSEGPNSDSDTSVDEPTDFAHMLNEMEMDRETLLRVSAEDVALDMDSDNAAFIFDDSFEADVEDVGYSGDDDFEQSTEFYVDID